MQPGPRFLHNKNRNLHQSKPVQQERLRRQRKGEKIDQHNPEKTYYLLTNKLIGEKGTYNKFSIAFY